MTDLIVGWALIAAAAFVIAAATLATHKHPARQDGQRKPPARRGTNPCTIRNCDRPATTAIRSGFDNWPVCARCREELGALRGEAL